MWPNPCKKKPNTKKGERVGKEKKKKKKKKKKQVLTGSQMGRNQTFISSYNRHLWAWIGI